MEGKAIADREVAFSGRLATMTRAEAVNHLVVAGGRAVRTPADTTDLVVVGQAGWPVGGDGLLTETLNRFRELKESGSEIRLVQETEFLEMLGLSQELEDLTRLYTTSQLSRIVDIPAARLRSWMRHGLIRPVKVTNRLAWFDFKDVVLARTIGQLTEGGVRPSLIRFSLERLGSWLPDADTLIDRLEAYEETLRVRLGDGSLAEVDGQLLFDFRGRCSGEGNVRVLDRMQIDTPDRWFGAGVVAEERGALDDAMDAYDRVLQTGGHEPEVYFNLGNVLYQLGREAEAAERYLQALEADREFAEAWNNLGNALSAVGKTQDAVQAYRAAIAMEPTYADAHCNLAAALDQLGRPADAYQHRGICARAYPTHLRLIRFDDREEEE